MYSYKKWFIITIFSLFGISIIYLLLIYYCNLLNIAEISWIYESSKKKEAIAKNIDGRKIVFAGGSATLFGVKTKYIEEKTGVPCVNMATHGGLNLDYIFSRLKLILNEGDIVILPLEYQYFSYDGKLNSLTLGYVLSFDKKFFGSLPLSSRLKYLISIPPIDLFRAIMLKIINKQGEYDAKTINSNGDETHNIGNDNISRRSKFFKPLELPYGNFKETFGLSIINNFNNWCKQHNITLYITYANLIYLKEYEDDKYRNYFDYLNNYFLERNIKTIGIPYNFFYKKELIYDSPYHLNEQGVVIRTKQLIEMLVKLDVIKIDKNN